MDTVESFLGTHKKVMWFKGSAPPLSFGKEPAKDSGHVWKERTQAVTPGMQSRVARGKLIAPSTPQQEK